MVISEKFEFIYIYIDFSYKKLKMEETLSNGLEKLTLNDDDEKVKKIKELEEKVKELEEKIKELENIPKHGDSISFKELIKENTNQRVIEASPEQICKIKDLAIKAQQIMINEYDNKFPVNSKGKDIRVNECGNFMEQIMDQTSDMVIDPLTDKGKKQDTGYPDRELKDEVYLEIKLVKSGSEGSTFRSFYISTFNKINKSLPHILVAFKHKDCILTEEEPLIIDLYDKQLKLKCEYLTNNKELYYMPKKPDYTIEDLDKIKGVTVNIKKI